MNEQQKEQLKEKFLAFRKAYDEFADFAYSISQEVGGACDLISIDRFLDIHDNLEEMGVVPPLVED